MIIQLKKDITPKQKDQIIDKLKSNQYKANEVKTQKGDYLIGIGKSEFDIREIGFMDGISDIHIVSDSYKLVSRKWKVEPTRIELGDEIFIGEGRFSIMAGPCSIEGEDKIHSTIEHLKQYNVQIMRGGVYKPRSSP